MGEKTVMVSNRVFGVQNGKGGRPGGDNYCGETQNTSDCDCQKHKPAKKREMKTLKPRYVTHARIVAWRHPECQERRIHGVWAILVLYYFISILFIGKLEEFDRRDKNAPTDLKV